MEDSFPKMPSDRIRQNPRLCRRERVLSALSAGFQSKLHRVGHGTGRLCRREATISPDPVCKCLPFPDFAAATRFCRRETDPSARSSVGSVGTKTAQVGGLPKLPSRRQLLGLGLCRREAATGVLSARKSFIAKMAQGGGLPKVSSQRQSLVRLALVSAQKRCNP